MFNLPTMSSPELIQAGSPREIIRYRGSSFDNGTCIDQPQHLKKNTMEY